jgi:hypothetical protein
VVQRIADRFGGWSSCKQLRMLHLEPSAQFADQRSASRPALGMTCVRALTADVRLDAIESGDAFQRFAGNRRVAALGEVAAAHVRPAERQHRRIMSAGRISQLLVGGVAVTLQDAAIAAEQCVAMLVPASEGVGVDHRGRVLAAPGPIIACDRPEVALFGAASARIEHRHDCLVGEQTRRGQHDFLQPSDDRRDLGSRRADPGRQRRAVERQALSCPDLRLSV